MTCTWRDCSNEAKYSQKDRNGDEWANLCAQHNKELDEAIDSEEPKKLLRCWVRASGGAEKLSKKIF